MAKSDRIIKLSCGVPGHEDDWIEIDTSAWTLKDFRGMIGGLDFSDADLYLKECVVDWHLTGDNGLVKFPGVTATDVAWDNALDRLGPGGLGLMSWLYATPSEALMEATRLSSKSSGDNDVASDGET